MAGSRSRWWTRRDTQRLISRANASNGQPITSEELRYLRITCEVLLNGPLDLCDLDRKRVAELYRCILAALGEFGVERIVDGQP